MEVPVNRLRTLNTFCLVALSIASLHAADLRLIDAVKNSDAKAVRSLLQQHADVNATEADGFTALHWAAQRDNLEIADLLLNAGRECEGCLPLQHYAPVARLHQWRRRDDRSVSEGGRRPQRHLRARPDRADDRRAHR